MVTMDQTEIAFLVDRMLGKLATYLRIFGVDTLYFNEVNQCALVEKAQKEGRVVLSKDAKLKKVAGRPEFLFIVGDRIDDQLRQVVCHFDLRVDPQRWFTRCIRCNTHLVSTTIEDIKGKVPSYIVSTQKTFAVCPTCGKVYWRGTHVKKMEERFAKILKEAT